MAESLEILSLKTNQQGQILDQYRASIYTLELKLTLLNKMFEEKGIFAHDEFDKRWPLFLKNDVGAVDETGIMQGSLLIHFYD
jgi:hypothetical protein